MVILLSLFEPLGLDWRYGVAMIMSFLAREVFVGALGTMFGMSGAEKFGLAAQIQADGLTLGAGIGLLLFMLLRCNVLQRSRCYVLKRVKVESRGGYMQATAF